MFPFAPIVNADAGSLGTLVGADFTAIELAVAPHAGTGSHLAVAIRAGTFDGLGHHGPLFPILRQPTVPVKRKSRECRKLAP
jgi:hypothetical protein